MAELLGDEGEVEDVGCAVAVDVALGCAKVLRDKDEVKDVFMVNETNKWTFPKVPLTRGI